jgi:O-antigen ligase
MKIIANSDVYHKLMFGLFAILMFFTPLLFTHFTTEFYEFPKMFFVYALGSTIILLFTLFNKQKVKWPNYFILGFLLANIVASIFSVNLYTSLWGYYGRFNDGLVSILIFFGLFFVAKNVFGKDDLFNLFLFSLFSIIPVSVSGIIQHLNGVDRVYSTIGQPNWLGQYLAVLLPFVLYLLFQAQNFKKFIFWFFIYCMGFSCLWFTYSMSSLLGFFVAVTTLTVLFFKKEKVQLLKIGVVVVFSLVIVFFNLGFFKNRLNDVFIDVKNAVTSTFVAYALDDGHLVSDPGFIRTGIWQGAFALIISTPKIFLLGTGPETFPYVFQKFRPAELNYSSEWDFILNKPHNYYLETWSEIGFFGLLAYLFILYFLVKRIPKFLLPSVVAFLITNIFGWPTVCLNLLFWMFLVYSDAYEKN